MDTYSHVLPGMQEEAAVVFENSLENTVPEAKANLFLKGWSPECHQEWT